jgi:hypothetical protein
VEDVLPSEEVEGLSLNRRRSGTNGDVELFRRWNDVCTCCGDVVVRGAMLVYKELGRYVMHDVGVMGTVLRGPRMALQVLEGHLGIQVGRSHERIQQNGLS